MKKNKGFTLIELLAVIVILGVLLAITTVAVNSIRKKQNVKNRMNVLSGVLTSAKNYMADYPNKLNFTNETISVTFKDLMGEKYKNTDYVDLDKDKYGKLLSENVVISKCGSNTLKLKYEIIDPYDDARTKYNDCGCEEQSSVGNSEELCKD